MVSSLYFLQSFIVIHVT